MRLFGTAAPLQRTVPSASAPVRRETSVGLMIAIFVWLTIAIGGTIEMFRYANAPGSSAQAPISWPTDSHIPLATNQPTVILFAHPRCPCTRASLGELEVLLGQVPGRLKAHVVFLKPANTAPNWEKTDLWYKASSIPGVTVHVDSGGIETRRFGSQTSGQTLFYDPSGKLRFQGGITVARGHAGDNPGRSALRGLLLEGHSNQVKTPVFGCSLFESQGDVACKP